MNRVGTAIAAAGQLGLLYAERLLKDVRPNQFARFARPGGVMIASNHPAFILGHLSLYPRRVLELLGQAAGAAVVPAEFDALFKAGVECRDDADGRLYPAMEKLTSLYFSAYRAANDAARGAGDEAYDRPNPAEGRMRELFPTLGPAINFYLVGHVQSHLGQFSAWRRMMGMGAA